MRYFIYLAYDGTAYHGWQIQPNAISVQQRLNEALSTLLRTNVETVGAGRTDTSVNAARMVAHFDYPSLDNRKIEPTVASETNPLSETALDCKRLSDKLCRILPRDISVDFIRRVKPDAHARFDATARTYHYDVYAQKNPFLRHYATRLFFVPDFALMNEAAKALIATEDFTSFSKVDSDAKTNICHVTRAEWVEVSPGHWRFIISADRFLRNMVRAIVGTLLDVGRGRISLEDFRRIIAKKDRCAAGESVPGNALSLVDIAYPEHIFLDNVCG